MKVIKLPNMHFRCWRVGIRLGNMVKAKKLCMENGVPFNPVFIGSQIKKNA